MRDLARQGHRAHLRHQPRLPRAGALRVAAEFPRVLFEHAGGCKGRPTSAPPQRARYYEARYLAGWLAGKTSRSGIAGCVAGFRCPRWCRVSTPSPSACARANPKAQVRVLWLNTVRPGARARDGAGAHQPGRRRADQPQRLARCAAGRAGRLRRLARACADRLPDDMRAFAPDAQLAAVTHHWGGYYMKRGARRARGAAGSPSRRGPGMKDGPGSSARLDARCPKELRAARRPSARPSSAASCSPSPGACSITPATSASKPRCHGRCGDFDDELARRRRRRHRCPWSLRDQPAAARSA